MDKKKVAMPTVCHGHSRPVVDLFYSPVTPDGYFFISASKGGFEKILRTYDLNRPDATPREIDKSPGSVRTVTWLHSDQTILSSCTDLGGVRLWDVRSGKIVQTLETKSPVTSAEVSQDGRFITTTDGSSVKFWDANHFGLVKSYNMPCAVESASLEPKCGNKFVTGGEDMWVRVFDFFTGEELACNKGHHGPVHCVRFTPVGESYASGSEDGTIRIWQLGPANSDEQEAASANGKAKVGVNDVARKIEGFHIPKDVQTATSRRQQVQTGVQMGNRRLTLAVPPFSIPQGDLEFSGNQLNKSRSNSSKQSPQIGTKSISTNISRIDHEREELNLEEWLNIDKFPPLTPGQGRPTVSFGLPKHSQPAEDTRHDRLHNQRPPPIAAIGSNSIMQRTGDVSNGIFEIVRVKFGEFGAAIDGNKAQFEGDEEMDSASWATRAEKGKAVIGPAQQGGLSIDDLLSHSFTPKIQRSDTTSARPKSTSRWYWIPAARVWDPLAERHPASGSDVHKFGAQAKHLRCIHPRTTDGRSYVEVA
ncbi:unnamed protein product [Miscanthus lutarioriparius]|uniref:Serine-threonine kinase receptor-associated protein n=1 Tax=Miscanthus lutarioriparius TaxID=422564 RepID=A0A811Q6B6_9POAL|nr:unnamed protein product [Miscanthus lutarioriparius]